MFSQCQGSGSGSGSSFSKSSRQPSGQRPGQPSGQASGPTGSFNTGKCGPSAGASKHAAVFKFFLVIKRSLTASSQESSQESPCPPEGDAKSRAGQLIPCIYLKTYLTAGIPISIFSVLRTAQYCGRRHRRRRKVLRDDAPIGQSYSIIGHARFSDQCSTRLALFLPAG